MKHVPLLPALLVFFISASALRAQVSLSPSAENAKVQAELIAEVTVAQPGQAFQAAVRLTHAEGWHTYGKELPPEVIGKPTRLKWTLPEGWLVEDLPWPPTHQVPSTDGKMSEGYDGTVHLPVKIIPAGKIGDQAELLVKVDALACDPKNCMPAKSEARLSLTLGEKAVLNEAVAAVFSKSASAPMPVDVPSPEPVIEKAAHSFGIYLLFAFIGGLILNIMPCVFPVLGIKIMSVVQQAGEDRRQVLLHGLTYTLGILICFWALGGLVVALGKSWGFQLQSPAFVFGLAAFFLVFALNMAGVFELGTSAVGVGAELQSKHGLGGSFFSGLLAVVVATPCSAPFLGPALGFAVTLPAGLALLMFSFIGLGLASPFLLLSFMPRLVSALPRPGAWMESFKQGMSFLLFGTVAFLTWVLTSMIEGQALLFTLLSLVVLSLGCWIYGRWSPPYKPARTRLIAHALTLACFGSGLTMGWPQVEKSSVSTAGSHEENGLIWQAWSPELEASLQAQNQAYYVDFTAKWCLTCQVNKRVYKNEALRQLIIEKNVTLLKADWTHEDPRITQALSALGKAAVPVNVLHIPGQTAPEILPELLTVENVSESLRKLP